MHLGLTREADYAVRAMLALAARPDPGPLSSRRIAEEWRIPPRFLVQVLGRLAEVGLVTASHGRNGGYTLARPASAITLLDVVTAIGSEPDERRCVLRGGPCLPSGSCLVHEAFTAARGRFRDELAGCTLDGVLANAGWRPSPPGASSAGG